MQKYYRAELIQHLTDWPSTQLEKQVGILSTRTLILHRFVVFSVSNYSMIIMVTMRKCPRH